MMTSRMYTMSFWHGTFYQSPLHPLHQKSASNAETAGTSTYANNVFSMENVKLFISNEFSQITAAADAQVEESMNLALDMQKAPSTTSNDNTSELAAALKEVKDLKCQLKVKGHSSNHN